MNTIKTTLTTEAVFSKDETKRYLLKKQWEKDKPKLAIILLAPSIASGVELDTTTQLVLNNASRLGYGSVAIVNLFATLDDFTLKEAEAEDPDNLKVITQEAQNADLVIYAPGIGKAKSKVFQQRQEQVLRALTSYEEKLHCLCDEKGNARLQHPLSPAVRIWYLSPFKVSELIQPSAKEESQQKKTDKAKTTQKNLPTS